MTPKTESSQLTFINEDLSDLLPAHRVSNENNPVLIYLARLAPSGRRSMLSRLTAVAALLGGTIHQVNWPALRYAHLEAIRAKLAAAIPTPSPVSVNTTLCALRGVARVCWHLGLMSAEEYQRLCAVESVKGSRLPAGRDIPGGEVAALLKACLEDEKPSGSRDAALIALIVGCGLRRSEAAALRVADYDQGTGSLKVRGKGNKERLVYLSSGAQEALNDWLTIRLAPSPNFTPPDSDSDETLPLLCPVLKNGRVVERQITDQTIYNALCKRASQAGIKHIAPHDGRRTFIGDLLDAGADLSAVQQLVGHANVTTTARYDRRGEKAKKKAASLLHLPYQSKA